MRASYYDNPNRMHIDTALKVFNRQTSWIGTGNHLGNTQTGWYIRPFNDTECNGFTFMPGHLRDFDLKVFGNSLPLGVREYVESVAVDESVILYKFFHDIGPSHRAEQIVHGYVVTRAATHELLRTFYTRWDHRSRNVVDECASYVSGRVYEVGERVIIRVYFKHEGITVHKAVFGEVSGLDRKGGWYTVRTDEAYDGKTEHRVPASSVYDADQMPILEERFKATV